MSSQTAWTVAPDDPDSLGSARRFTLRHPSGAVYTVAELEPTPEDPDQVHRWWLWNGAEQGSMREHLARCSSAEEATNAVMSGVGGLLAHSAYLVGLEEGRFWPEFHLAEAVCPVHGWGLLVMDDGCSWQRQDPQALGLAGVGEVWIYHAYGAVRHLVVHDSGAGEGPWVVWSTVDFDTSPLEFTVGPGFASRHCAVAHVESLRDTVPLALPTVLPSDAECGQCGIEGPITIEQIRDPRP